MSPSDRLLVFQMAEVAAPRAVPGHPQSAFRVAPARRDPMLTREGLLPPQSQGGTCVRYRRMTAVRGEELPLARRVDRNLVARS